VDSLRLPEDGGHVVLRQGSRELSPQLLKQLASEANIFLARPEIGNQPSQIESWTLSEITGRFTLVTSATLTAAVQSLFVFGEVLAAQEGREVHLFDEISLNHLGFGTLPSCVGEDLRHAAGDITRGLWVPLGDYGLKRIAVGSMGP
jgi:hypothetical protein